MKSLLVAFFFTLSFVSFAHRGEYLSVAHVTVSKNKDFITYSFELENIKKIDLTEIQIDFVLNGVSIQQFKVNSITANQKFIPYRFKVPRQQINLEEDIIQIEITQLFGTKNDWGGWDSPQEKQVNVPGTYEIFADVPWRMNKNDAQGNENSIPVLCYIHGAGGLIYASLETINIYVKSARDTVFGAPLAFDSYSQQDFENLFTNKSITDNDFDVQAFDMNSTLKDANNTMLFVKDTSAFIGDVRTVVNSDFWYFTFNIPPSKLVGLTNEIDVRIDFTLNNATDAYTKMRIFRSETAVPKIANYYRGDTHLHSIYTQNSAELGSPLAATKEAAKHVGIDWITATDHTSDFDNYGASIAANWARLGVEAANLNSIDPSLIYIRGQEVALNNSNADLVHFLAYPSFSAPLTPQFLGDGNGDLTSTNVTINSALDSLYSYNGFAYAAHPFASADKLPTIPIGGGIWNLGDTLFPLNGANFPNTGGTILNNNDTIASDVYSSATNLHLKNALKGVQIWNDRNTLLMTGDNENPWDVNNLGAVTPFAAVDTAQEDFHFTRFKQGQEVLNHINIQGLKKKNANPTLKNWKLYLSAGSDAHGSFNYSNTNDFLTAGNVNNNAIGKLNTLAYCPEGMGTNGENILKAMYNGNTAISDGPIVIQGISTNGNDTDFELIMGEDAIISEAGFNNSFYTINYATTPEFGEIKYLKVCIGTETGETCKKIAFNAASGNITQNYPLKEIIETVLGTGNTPKEQFFYIRTQIETFADYAAAGTADMHRLDSEYFHSFSNPIWLRVGYYTAINELNSSLAKIHPNPFKNQIIIDFTNTVSKNITIVNSIGQVVFQEKNYASKQLVIDSQLKAGIYFITITSDNKTESFKVVKAR